MSAPDRLRLSDGEVAYYALTHAADASKLERLPYVVRIFIENVLRFGGESDYLQALVDWPQPSDVEFPFRPARVILQDFTGVPVVADLAAMRAAVARAGGDVRRVNPQVPLELLI